MIRKPAPLTALLALGCAVLLGACSTLGDFFASAQPACEPSTGQTYTVSLLPGKRYGPIARAATPDARCVAPTARVQIQARVMCLARDGQSLAVAWDADSNSGVAYVSSTKLPGCDK